MEITPFDFSGKTVRILTDDKGNPWWLAADVCKVLGILNAPHAVNGLKNDEKNTIVINDSIPGNPKKIIINEPGLYRLLLRSTKKRAAKFQRWVFHDVLPEIRKTGSYSIEKQPKLPQDYEQALEALLVQVKENKTLLPKAKALDAITDTTSLKSLTEGAKVMSIKPKELIRRLERSKILYRKRNRQRTLLPFQYYIDNEWFEVKLVGPGEEKKYTQTLLTPRGIAKLRVRYSLQ